MSEKYFVTSKSGRYFNQKTGKWLSFSEALSCRDRISPRREFSTPEQAQAAVGDNPDLQISHGRYR